MVLHIMTAQYLSEIKLSILVGTTMTRTRFEHDLSSFPLDAIVHSLSEYAALRSSLLILVSLRQGLMF